MSRDIQLPSTAGSQMAHLPPYPSTQSRKSLSPSQLATLNQTVSASILDTISLPPNKRDTPAVRAFISSYAKDAAFQILKSLIWGDQNTPSKDDQVIRKLVLLLTEKLVLSPPAIDSQTLLDISIIYASTNTSRTRAIFSSTFASSPLLSAEFESEAVPAFVTLLSSDHCCGLYGLRKSSHCLSSLLHVFPPDVILSFSSNKTFILALAKAYDDGLGSIALSYGGMHLPDDTHPREFEEWERLWVEIKVALMDSFHILITSLLTDLTIPSVEHTFDIISTLIDLPSSSSTNLPSTPFLNRPILSDYQQSYDLAHRLASKLQHHAADDARVELLETTLHSLGATSSVTKSGKKDAGALKLLMRPSAQLPKGPSRDVKGKGKAPPQPLDSDIDLKISQILDVLPGHPASYIKALLQHSSYPFKGNAEKVIEALLEGTAPSSDEVDLELDEGGTNWNELYEVGERRNVWDEEVMDLSKVRMGKNRLDEAGFFGDRTFIEQMKADIIRRAEEMSDSDDEANEHNGQGALAFEEDDQQSMNTLKVLGDGEESNSGSDPEDEGDGSTRANPETILELAYIRDPTLFNRDSQTRRGKGREELKASTGWGDEQIEGWRIMLERNPKKDKILEKHNGSGNLNQIGVDGGTAAGRGGGGGGGRGGGRGQVGGGGNGRGQGSAGGDSSARGRAWKDKNKASRANHNRKRGHDKKMANSRGPSA